jgi:purine nucleoside permease
MALPDPPGLAELRAGYPQYPAAQCAPAVVVGDEATGQTFWHGKLLNDHVEKWVAYWTDRKASFVVTGMEDTGVAHALAVLGGQGKADPNRLLVLRTASNYTIQPSGKDAAGSLAAESNGLSALKASTDAAFTVGSKVANEITGNWPRYRNAVPSGSPAAMLDPATCKKP